MAQHNRYRGSNRPYQDNDYSYSGGGRQGQRYPGSMSGEFSQFGGPRPGGYRDYAAGETGWNPAGGYDEQRDYGAQRDRSRGYDYESRGYRGGEDYDRYQDDEPYSIQRGGYPDYSGYQRDNDRRSGSQGYNYSSQDRGNMDAPMDRDWGTYGQRSYGQSPRQGGYQGERYSGRQSYDGRNDYGGGQGYGQGGYGQTGYGAQRGGYSGQRDQAGDRYSGQSGYYGEGSNTQRSGGYSGSSESGSSSQNRRQGPKGYQRSDERVREQIVERFMDTSVDLDDVEIDVKDGVVTLTGQVGSRHCRHELENVADSVWGVKEVNNNVKVRSGDKDSSRHTEVKPGSSTTGSTGSTQRENTSSQQASNRNR